MLRSRRLLLFAVAMYRPWTAHVAARRGGVAARRRARTAGRRDGGFVLRTTARRPPQAAAARATTTRGARRRRRATRATHLRFFAERARETRARAPGPRCSKKSVARGEPPLPAPTGALVGDDAPSRCRRAPSSAGAFRADRATIVALDLSRTGAAYGQEQVRRARKQHHERAGVRVVMRLNAADRRSAMTQQAPTQVASRRRCRRRRRSAARCRSNGKALHVPVRRA